MWTRQVIVSVTTLGARAGSVGRAADNVVGYLEGSTGADGTVIETRRSQQGSLAHEHDPAVPVVASRVGGYYADSAEVAGRWRGRGSSSEGFDLGTTVEAEAFRRVLLGQDPYSGEQLLAAAGSAGRSRGHARGLSNAEADPSEILTTAGVAEIAGVDVWYVGRLAAE